MKTIGVLGGMSAASTQLYYAELCALFRKRAGGLHSPELLIRSLDFARIEPLQAAGDWAACARILNREARALERAGAAFLLLATNTMHRIAEPMMDGLAIPLLHIADATADAVRAAGARAPGLMATRFTMEQRFYVERLEAAGLSPVLPPAADRAEIHRIIYEELCKEVVTEPSRRSYRAIAQRLEDAGADSLILGCTEIGMLLGEGDVAVPVIDSTLAHCRAAIDLALEGRG